jgi:hypothetical protein
VYSRGFVLYAPRLAVPPRAALLAAADVAGTKRLSSATRLRRPDAQWVALLTQDLHTEFVQEGGSVDDCCDDHIPGRPLAVSFADSKEFIALSSSIAAALPAEIIGDLGWVGFYSVVGPHDIIDFGTYYKETTKVALAQFSFGLSSNTAPSNWSRFKECVFRIPEVEMLQHQLEQTFGPLRRWVSF